MASRLAHALLAATIAVLVHSGTARADIAPTQYVGYGIVPVDAPDMRMISAHVDITWGTPCTLAATFVIENQSTKPREIDLGFPITHVDSMPSKAVSADGFSFSFDGVPLAPSAMAIDDPATRMLRSLTTEIPLGDSDHDLLTAIQFLQNKSKELDPEHRGILFVLTALAPDKAKRFGWHHAGTVTLLQLLDDLLSDGHLQYSVNHGTVYLHTTIKGAYNPDDFVWYRCHYTFPPGKTTVAVQSKLIATRDYNLPFCEHLFYCIETGGAWNGTIGSEVVEIHFPGPVTKEQILSGNPADFSIVGNLVRWQFKDFKPHGEDHDIELRYLRPDILAALAGFRTELARDPTNVALILKLARNLFALGPYKGYASYPPSNLQPDEMKALLARIPNEQDRARFNAFYSLDAKGLYQESDEQWQTQGGEILRILNAMDYVPPSDHSVYVDEARALVEKLLSDQPANAAAWDVYFANYYRFHLAGGPSEYGWFAYYPLEVAQIRKAVALCPNDTCLQLLSNQATASGDKNPFGPDMTALLDRMRKQGAFSTDYPSIKRDED